jgi:hypothetical protein
LKSSKTNELPTAANPVILTIFRPKRIKNGKPYIARSYRGRYRLDEEDKLTDIPLHTTDKRVARERLERIVREEQLEAVGSAATSHRFANRVREASFRLFGRPPGRRKGLSIHFLISRIECVD